VNKFISMILCICAAMMVMASSAAAYTGHYINGVEGIRAATLPPPGYYYRMYTLFYSADALRDGSGDELNVGFEATALAIANRFIYSSNYSLLGGNYIADIIIPVVYQHINIGVADIDDSQFGIGDICVEPFVLAWHGDRYDAAVGAAFYAPTGKYDKSDAASIGKDFYSVMFTAGGTCYFDPEKTIAASVLARYETHSRARGDDIKPGDDFHFEYGISKTVGAYDVGLAGYCQWQIGDDDGTGASDIRDSVFALGPEFATMIPSLKLLASLRAQLEFGAEDRPEGKVVTLTLTKIF
jgi:hypothetical protein